METLADRIARDGPLNELDAVGWTIRLTKKLEALHSRGQAHGGVSPAAVKTAAVPRTSLGMLIAGPSAPSRTDFHSPERVLKGTKALADDTWAAAATLYTLLTGASPFHASDEDGIRQKIVSTSPAPLSSFDVGDDDLQHILDAAFERDASRRASTITALRQALESWHPDATVKDLPALADDQPEDDDEDDARTVMRQMPAMQAVARAAMAKREAGPASAPRASAQTVPNMPAVTALAAATVPGAPLPKAHDLLEDDDENAKTSLMKVPMVPGRKPAPAGANLAPVAPAAPASTRGPASAGVRPVVPQPGPAFGMMGRAAGGPAARAAVRPAVGARPAQPAPAAAPKTPLAPPVSGISREAVFDDGDDDDATVMREAPLELLMQTTNDGGGEADRATPVNPISAEVAAAAAGSGFRDEPTPPAHHAIDDEATVMRDMPEPPPPRESAPMPVPMPAPEVRAPEPTMVLPEESSSTSLPANLADLAPQPHALPDLFGSVADERPPLSPEQAMRAAAMPPPAQAPFAIARESAPSPLAIARESAPSPLAIARESAPSPLAIVRESAPSPLAIARESAPSPRVTPPPPIAMQPAQPAPPSAAKGLLLGMLFALVLLLAGVGVYFAFLKK
ncbi:hypothetical protein [Polyangium mundeleinium]|uniref:Protein kinase domain-containing protein n=1 Tax=Polyangium mundeleinium TaxID=2995306 RepID=A0ABT5F017_9BACT|nr:hypothetical protein [Polyangium mundeleinium]MDC0747425.1 hypothetical protein [Polyangium mundeleinium]